MTIEEKIEFGDALTGWLNCVNNYKRAEKYGAKLNQFDNEIPKEIKQGPHTLYRMMWVAEKLFRKTLKGKPLVLKNRTFSSWSYSLDAAKHFATHFTIPEKYVVVLLRRQFKTSELFLNVESAVKWLHKETYDFSGSIKMVELEKEIIVKNIHRDFKFKPEEIYAYKLEPDGIWYEGQH